MEQYSSTCESVCVCVCFFLGGVLAVLAGVMDLKCCFFVSWLSLVWFCTGLSEHVHGRGFQRIWRFGLGLGLLGGFGLTAVGVNGLGFLVV